MTAGSVVAKGRVCPGCGALLSRYNPDRRCAACVRSARPDRREARQGPGYLAEQVTHLRRKAGLSRRDLAVKAELTEVQVRSVEKGDRDFVPVRTVVALADALGVPVAALHGSVVSPGQWVRAARAQRGMTLQMLAQLSGVSVSQISELERGRKSFSRLSAADALATALGLSLRDLVLSMAEHCGGDAGEG